MDIRVDDLTHPSVIALLQLHLDGMHANSPPDSVYALDLTGLRDSNVTVWTIWQDDVAVGIGALKMIALGHGEIKSMRTHPEHIRQGVGKAMLEKILQEAKARGLNTLSLETGSGDAFDAAIALYEKYGFEVGNKFGDYEATDFNQFMHLNLI